MNVRKYKCIERKTYGTMLLLMLILTILPLTFLAFHIRYLETFLMFCVLVSMSLILESAILIVASPHVFATLTISKNQIIWQSPFYKSVRLQFDECIYVGVGDSSHNLRRAIYANAYLNACGRGDTFCYIYISPVPPPKKCFHKINSLHSKKRLIIFPYDDKVCQGLIEALPPLRTGQLVSFYNALQARDLELKKRKEKKKRKNQKALEEKKKKKLEKKLKKKNRAK